MEKYTFEDVYINKVFGEVEECDRCWNSGVFHEEEKLLTCKKCNGKGFIKVKNRTEIIN